MLVAVVVVILAWGALAFGAVYPWAYKPLFLACAATGAWGLFAGRRRRSINRQVAVCLVLLTAAVVVQLVPLPPGVLKTLSPATDTFLRTHDISYAFAVSRHPLSIKPSATVLGLAALAAFGLFLLGLLRSLNSARARRLAGAIIALGILLSFIGIFQKATIGDHAYGGMRIYGVWAPENKLTTPFGPFVNKNHFAGWMLMAVPLAIGLALGTTERGARRVHDLRSYLLWLSSPDGGRFQLLLFASVIMSAALLFTKSRSGLGCFVILTIAAGIAASRRFDTMRMRITVLGSAFALFVVVFAWAGAEVAARVGQEISAVDLRRDIWSDSATIIRDFPIAGTGLNTFGTAMLRYQTDRLDMHFQEAHNDYLQVIVEGGALVALPALALLAVVVLTIRRRLANREEEPATRWLRIGAVISLIAIGIQSFVEFSLQMPGNAALFVVVLAIAMHDSSGRTHGASARPTK